MSDDKIIINYKNIYDYIEDRSPYLFVDYAEVIPEKSSFGYKNFTMNEWFFSVHFPGDPIVPAVFQLEAITQCAGLSIQVMKEKLKTTKLYIKKYTNVELYSAVRPGDKLYIETEIQSFRRGIIKANGCTYTLKDNDEKEQHCFAEFQMIMPELFQQFTPKGEN